MNRLGWWMCTGLIPTAFMIIVLAIGIGSMAQIGFSPDKMRYMSEAQAEAYMQANLMRWTQSNGGLINVYLLSSLVLTWISTAATIKRFHDRGKSGFWILISIIPLLGPIWIFIECGFLSGTDSGNRFDVEPSGDEEPSQLSEHLSSRMQASAKAERDDFGFGSGSTMAKDDGFSTPKPAVLMAQAFPNGPRKSFGVKR